uniref:Uncharacterized protein n=1 Tax=Arundo donax TaxID=35708 RepID=A0A0A9D2A6_ARUDO
MSLENIVQQTSLCLLDQREKLAPELTEMLNQLFDTFVACCHGE